MSRSQPCRPFRIGIDMDGVVADLASALSREAGDLFGESAPDHAMPPLDERRRRRLWSRVREIENFWETLDEIEPGGLARLAGLAVERRWDIIFLTTRPETDGRSAQLQTHRWLSARGFQHPSVFVVQKSRGAVAAALELDAVIDDRPDNCVDVVSESAARAILVHRAAGDLPGAGRLRVDVVRRFDECLDLLIQIDLQRQPARTRLAAIFHALSPRPAVPAV